MSSVSTVRRRWQCSSPLASVAGRLPGEFLHTRIIDMLQCPEGVGKDILQGASTTKYPIEVVPFALGSLPGDPAQAFSLTTSIGSCVVTSAYCFCVYVMDKQLLSGDLDDVVNRERLRPLCERVLQALNVSAIHEPSQDLSDIVFKSNKFKIEASQRTRPTILQYGISYSKVADQLITTKKAGRKSRAELIVDQILNHNKKETVRSSRIKTDEIAALKNVVVMSDWAQRRLKVIWQSQLPPYSSVPISLLASKFLSPVQEIKVNKDEKPVWLDILQYSTAKSDAWLARTDGKFVNVVKTCRPRGRDPTCRTKLLSTGTTATKIWCG